MKPAAPKKNVRARLMYGYYRGPSPQQSWFCVTNSPDVDGNGFIWDDPRVRPVAVLEATPEAYAMMRLAMAKAIWHGRKKHALPMMPLKEYQSIYLRQARLALAAIGIQPAARVARSRRDA